MCICYLKTIFVSWNTNLIVHLHRFGSLKHKFAKLWVSKFVFLRTNLISTNLWFQNTNLTVFWGNLCFLTFVFLYLRFHVCFFKTQICALFKNANNNIQNANISKKGKIWNRKFVFSDKTNLLFFPYICSNSTLWCHLGRKLRHYPGRTPLLRGSTGIFPLPPQPWPTVRPGGLHGGRVQRGLRLRRRSTDDSGHQAFQAIGERCVGS